MLAFLCALVACKLAVANGRFPRAQQLLVDPMDAQHLFLSATYGLVETKDGGKTWQLICESSVGYAGADNPALGLMEDGNLLAGVLVGLQRSSQDACDWAPAAQDFVGSYASDLTVQPDDRRRVFVLTSDAGRNQTYVTRIWLSEDNGQSWAKWGVPLPERFLGLTLDPAPSDEKRMYVSGIAEGGVGVLAQSSDGGQSWQIHPVPNADIQRPPFIGGVDPALPNRVYVRTAGTDLNRLMVTDDGGATFQELLARPGRMLGFRLSPDGSQVAVGFGDPRDFELPPDAELGLFVANTSAFQFDKIYAQPVNCITWTPSAFYICGSQPSQGFELAVAPTPSFPASTEQPFTPLMTLEAVSGPKSCGRDTSGGALCDNEWQSVCPKLGGDDCPDAGVSTADAGSDAGADAADASADAADAQHVAPASFAARGGDCGCSSVGRSPVGGASLLLLGLLRLRRRRGA